MIQHTPPAQPITIDNSNVQESLKTDLSSLSDGSIGEYFRSLKLRHYIEAIIEKNESMGITTDVSIMDLQSQRSIVGHNLDTEQFAASVNKVPVARLVLNDLRSGKLQFDQQLTWAASDKRGGAGVYDQPDAPLQASVKDLVFDMLNPSGNTAVRVLVNAGLGGAPAVNERFANELHLQHTYLQPLEGNRFYVGNSTARDAMTNIQQLLAGNDQYQQFVKKALATNIYTDFGVRTQLAGNDFITLANKVGILDDPEGNNRHDVGIIYNTSTHKSYAFAFMNTAPGASYSLPTAQAGVSLADMGKGTLRFAGDKPHRTDHQSSKTFQGTAIAPEQNRIEY